MENTSIRLSREEMPYPLCVVGDRYGGTYSGAEFLAFNLYPDFVAWPVNH